ncbi:MAG: NUDIX hydrolase [Alphaproteobacteria bacterium]|nr:NUDIX hydrolase [Alphaproteobacteria bacterium]
MPDWVNVVALTEDDRLVLVRQHRFGIDQETLEIPGGCVDPGETPAEAAVRELREETGYGGGALAPMGVVWSNPAIQDNRTWLFAMRGARRLGAPELGPGEQDLRVELRPRAALPGMLERGAIDHALAVVALQRFLLRQR